LEVQLGVSNFSTLWIVGTPLDDEGKLSAAAIECINSADLIIAESKKNGFRYLKQTEFKESTPLFFLDPFREDTKREIQTTLKQLAREDKKVVLFSDTGMPILFDPGSDILQMARELRFTIRSLPSATSWGTACALSGWEPPFLILGFLSREIAERKKQLAQLKNASHHTLLMDTPYRFEALIDHAAEVLGPKQEVFLAWELAKSQERLIWGSIQQIQREAEQQSLKKGEFILIIRGNSRVK
jgi:16S rRNA (cytidine1402-2'-O)-methyltransferase